MTPKPRVVFDTGVLVSALLFDQSSPSEAFSVAVEEAVIHGSAPSISELEDVLGRKKFDRYLTVDERQEFLIELLRISDLIEITCRIAACRDPKDDKFLELAKSGNATCIVSGDNDLLVLKEFDGIPILTPVEFLHWWTNL